MTPEDAPSSSDDAYVHRPGELEDETADGDDGPGAPPHPAAVDREFDWRGWTLVGVLFVALVVAPLLIYLRPPALPWRVTLVVLPLAPAILLGIVAVWATTRP